MWYHYSYKLSISPVLKNLGLGCNCLNVSINFRRKEYVEHSFERKKRAVQQNIFQFLNRKKYDLIKSKICEQNTIFRCRMFFVLCLTIHSFANVSLLGCREHFLFQISVLRTLCVYRLSYLSKFSFLYSNSFPASFWQKNASNKIVLHPAANFN